MSFNRKDDRFPLRNEYEKVVSIFHVGRIVGSNLQTFRQLRFKIGLGRQVTDLDKSIVGQSSTSA